MAPQSVPVAAAPIATMEPLEVNAPTSSPPSSSLQSVLVRSHRFALYEYECLVQCFRIPSAPSTSACLMVFYSFGLVVCFGAYAYVLERLTIDGNGPNEFVLMFVCCVVYAILSYVGKVLAREQHVDTAPWYVFLVLSFTTFSSTFLSTYSLRYVSYVFRVLGKTCKPIPIMAIGLALGKRYPPRKYLSVAMVTVGAMLFFVYKSAASSSSHHHSTTVDATAASSHNAADNATMNAEIGALLLVISLFFDGATGALEEKFMTQYQMGPFTMMHKINVVSTLLSAVLIVVTSQEATLLHVVANFSVSRDLLLLGLCGGVGQMFIFLMISRFGALMTSVAGTARKILTLCVSILAFGHVLTQMQYVGLAVAVAGMCVNLVRGHGSPTSAKQTLSQEALDTEETTGFLQDDKDGDDADHDERRRRDDDDDEDNVPPSKGVFPDVRGNLVPKQDEYGIAIDIAFRATTSV
ncbi:hypothetical protein H257_11547 [Aphanomyces astaci]|uniref:Sugar phosphate transporter domain-containing protein n=2 Tax=Aphanomyces astaci TaxID=112090 RepID=W4G2H9_APHAT|nr:hypothetical protein H257_11547 [Aphanomyces astaci]ETV73890.1 hypothetical protein H257_11547 [Aphanomyces astaci]|eukprot:XP_009836826.1 hypothetical protein H257_11547 [Aphanomyces astaci]